MGRIEREKQTVERMISVFCKCHHKVDVEYLCPQCRELCSYAHSKLDKCPFGENKTSCRKCNVHCYKPKYKAEIAKVMRYVGPRMILIEPITTIRHIWSEVPLHALKNLWRKK